MTTTTTTDYYTLLGVPTDATTAQIKSAYRKLAKQYHPDVNDSSDAAEKFREITEAYDTLTDPDRRRRYDRLHGTRRATFTDDESSRYTRPGTGSANGSRFQAASPILKVLEDVWLEIRRWPCHARRDPGRCPHGRHDTCFTRHRRDDPKLGQPLCPDCYDYAAHVVWNNQAGELWRRTKQAIERHLGQLARRRGVPPIRIPRGDGKYRLVDPVRVAHGKAAEYQARGAVHFHALLRLDGYDPADPDRLLPPPACITAADLDDATRWAARAIAYRTPPHPARPGGWTIGWGTEIDIRVITLTGSINDLAVASYLAKYSTKGTEVTGHASARISADTLDLYASAEGTHPERLIAACWTIGAEPGYVGLRRWAHMLGFGGHFLTKARRYSIRFADLRQARISYRRGRDTGPEHGPIRTADHADEETVLIVGTFTYAGTGWKTSGDALLANTAADQARKRRQAGRDQLVDEYNRASTGRQAA